jgi:hypothetical protein
MQKSKKVITCAVMIAFAVTSNAQKVIVSNVNDFESCRSYLVSNPTDTLVSDSLGTIKVFMANGRVVRTSAKPAKSFDLMDNKLFMVKDAHATALGAKRVEKDGKVTEFEKTTIKGMSYADQLSFLAGETEAYNIRNRGLDGRLQQRYTVYALAGAFYGDSWAPVATVGMSHAFWPHVDLGVEAEYSRLKYVGNSEAEGNYDSFGLFLTAKWFPIQNKFLGGASRLGAGIAPGYMLQRTDSEKSLQSSKNYGASCKFFVEANLSLGGNWYLVAQAGAKWYPRVEHNYSQKLFDYIGGYAQLGAAFRF